MFELINNNRQNMIYADAVDEAVRNGIYDIFDFIVTPILDKNYNRVVKYELYLKDSIYKDPIIKAYVDEKDNLLGVISSSNDKQRNMFYFGILESMYKNVYDNVEKHDRQVRIEGFIKRFVELEQEHKEEIYNARRARNLNDIQSLLNAISTNETILLSDKVHIEPELLMDKDDLSLAIKIGIDKMYIIQSIPKFIISVLRKDVIKYGKNLEFNHQIENFDEQSQKLINILTRMKVNNDYMITKYVSITPSIVDEILNIYKGSYITFNSNIKKEVKVTLADYNLDIEFNKEHELVLNNEGIILKGQVDDYFVTNDSIKKIKYLDNINKNIQKELLYSLYEGSKSFSYIEDVFKKEIYPRFNKVIKIDESIKKELDVKNYTIRAYFDYSDVLSVDTKYFNDETEVSLDDAKDYLYQLSQYQNYLNNFGFVEDEISDMTKIVNFLRSDLSELKNVCEVYLSQNITRLKVKQASKISAHLSYDVGMLQICFETSEFSDEELNKIIKSFRKKLQYVKLNKDTIIDLNDENLQKFYNTINEFNLDIDNLKENQDVQLYQSLKLLDNDLEICDYLVDDKLKELLKDIASYKKHKYEYPESLKKCARSYQIEAFKWMKTLIKYGFCGILADDMGLGKTFEVISVLLDDDVNVPSLIVCPKSLCYNWRNEFNLWGKDLDVINVIGSISERNEIINNIDDNKKSFYITSYDSLRNDIDLYLKHKFRFIILDEAQSIKNHGTLKAQSVKMLKSELRFVLTGTPIENTIIDLWSIFDFLMPNYLGVYNSFKSKYERSIIEENASKTSEQVMIKALVKKITPFILRRTKEDVLKDLPEKMEIVQMASMDTAQKKVYDSYLKMTRDFMQSSTNKKLELLAMLTRMREICVDPAMFIDNYEGSSCKLDLLDELISNYIEEGHKIVIFSQFTSIFEKIEGLLKKKNIAYFILTGKTQALDRVDYASRFNEKDSKEKVFLVSLKAGGTGLNLVGADVVIHLDPWWNYAVENQATDRTHRIGQTRAVTVIKLIVENSIEQKVIELQNIKKDLASKIIKNDTDDIEKLSVDDIKFLLD